MCLVYDVVLNHVRPVHSVADLTSVRPFDSPDHYNTLGRRDGEPFDAYRDHLLEKLEKATKRMVSDVA